MPLLSRHREGELIWGIWKMEEMPEMDKRTREREAVNALLAELSGERKVILHEASGKPYLEDASFQISISHTKGYAAVILHPSLVVGIDIERYGTKVNRVREKFLQPQELDELQEEDGDDDTFRLLLYWSAKETVYKALGIENVELKKHIFVFPFEMEEEGEMNAVELKTGTRKEFPIKYIVHKDFVLTYTSRKL